MSRYLLPSDDMFYTDVNSRFAKYKIPRKQKTLKEFCFPKQFSLQIPQRFLADFINPETPYRGLLVYHKIGSGKTCAAANICEGFKGRKRIMIVLPASLKGNFLSELRSPCVGNAYLTETERKQLASLHPGTDEYREIIDESNARIDEVYTIYSYNKFVELLQRGQINLTNTLLVIDEVHNMISATGIYYKTLYEAVHAASDDFRLVIMTATPIFDKPNEIALTMNLLLRGNLLPTGPDFISTFMDITITQEGYEYRVKNMGLFKEYIRGYVSYYRGAPPYVYPRVEQEIVKVPMSERQRRLYTRVIKREAGTTKVQDFVNVNISNSFFIGTRMVSNIAYPNNMVGLDGFQSMKRADFSLSRLAEFSPKFVEIIKRINRSTGPIFVYSNFKEYGGIAAFAAVLEHHGFLNYEEEGVGRKRFAIWSGDQDPVLKEEVKAVFNHPLNVNGSQIKVVLGSPSIKEGVTLLRVQQVHIIEPYWNFSRMDQIMGRAIRFCSHKDLPVSKQVVKVYIYLATHPKLVRSIDEYIYSMALTKREVNGAFERALQESAIDCELFKNANVYPGEPDIRCMS